MHHLNNDNEICKMCKHHTVHGVKIGCKLRMTPDVFDECFSFKQMKQPNNKEVSHGLLEGNQTIQ